MRKRLVKYENAPALHMKLREQFLTSIRDVKSNGFTAPGVIPSRKNKAMVQYESIPERDMAYFLEFSAGVKRFVEQPVKIDYIGPSGKPAHYTPDFLAYFSDNLGPDKIKPTLFEVKTREILKKNWNELKPKFMAAIRYCDTKGWRFKIITEVELNTPYVENAKFLVPYMRKAPSIGLIENVMDALHELEDHATPAHIIKIAANDFYRKAALIPALWFLVATRFIGCELDKPLTMDSNVWYIKS
jgi:hypothetical protein